MDIRNIRNSVEISLHNNAGKVDQATVDELVGQATTAADKKMLVEEFSRDKFDSGVDTKALAKSLGVKSLDTKEMVDVVMGTDPSGAQVRVSHDFSPKGGFDNYAKAAATARIFGSDKAAVVEKNHRYYAVETNVSAEKMIPAKDAPTLDASGGLTLRQYDKLLENTKTVGGKDAWADLAAYTYGVPKDKINVITDVDVEKAGGKLPAKAPPAINIYIGTQLKGDESGMTGPIGDARGANIVKGVPQAAAVVIEADAFTKDPARAQKILFHEGTHLEHNDRLVDLYDKYKQDKASKGKHPIPFEGWISKQKLPAAEKQLMMDLSEGKTADTEALAHVESFVASFNKWTVASSTTAGRQAQEGSDLLVLPKNPDKAVAKLAQDELMEFYNSMPPSTQRSIRKTLEAMKSVEGTDWLLKQGPVADMLATAEPKGW